MKSEWRITSNKIDGVKKYAVYRLYDVQKIDHSGNREFGTGYLDSREEAVKMADKLNAGTKCKECGV